MPQAFSVPPHRPDRSAFWQQAFYNLRVDELPVHADSAAAMATTRSFHSSAAGRTYIEVSTYGEGEWDDSISDTNLPAGYFIDSLPEAINPATARVNWNLADANASTPNPQLWWSGMRQEGVTQLPGGGYAIVPPWVSTVDKHSVLWSESSSELLEVIQYAGGWPGTSAHAMRVATFDLDSYTLPPNVDGGKSGVVAARFPVAPFAFTWQDLVDCGEDGDLGHALGWICNNARNTYVWPARASDGTRPDGLPYGSCIRLKPTFNLASIPTAEGRALARTMMRHGVYLFDKNVGRPGLFTVNDPDWPEDWGEDTIGSLLDFNQFDWVDISSVAGPANSIQVTDTDPGGGGGGGGGGGEDPPPPTGVDPVAFADRFPARWDRTFAFTSTGSYAPSGYIASYAWDFGDGGTSTLENPLHSYAADGEYEVTLTVTDNHGATDTYTLTVVVEYLVRDDVVAVLEADVTSGAGPLTVNFDASSSTAGAPITVYFWDFGDGHYSFDVSPTHTYEHPGAYIATLAVSADYGGPIYSDNVFEQIVVSGTRLPTPTLANVHDLTVDWQPTIAPPIDGEEFPEGHGWYPGGRVARGDPSAWNTPGGWSENPADADLVPGQTYTFYAWARIDDVPELPATERPVEVRFEFDIEWSTIYRHGFTGAGNADEGWFYAILQFAGSTKALQLYHERFGPSPRPFHRDNTVRIEGDDYGGIYNFEWLPAGSPTGSDRVSLVARVAPDDWADLAASGSAVLQVGFQTYAMWTGSDPSPQMETSFTVSNGVLQVLDATPSETPPGECQADFEFALADDNMATFVSVDGNDAASIEVAYAGSQWVPILADIGPPSYGVHFTGYNNDAAFGPPVLLPLNVGLTVTPPSTARQHKYFIRSGTATYEIHFWTWTNSSGDFRCWVMSDPASGGADDWVELSSDGVPTEVRLTGDCEEEPDWELDQAYWTDEAGVVVGSGKIGDTLVFVARLASMDPFPPGATIALSSWPSGLTPLGYTVEDGSPGAPAIQPWPGIGTVLGPFSGTELSIAIFARADVRGVHSPVVTFEAAGQPDVIASSSIYIEDTTVLPVYDACTGVPPEMVEVANATVRNSHKIEVRIRVLEGDGGYISFCDPRWAEPKWEFISGTVKESLDDEVTRSLSAEGVADHWTTRDEVLKDLSPYKTLIRVERGIYTPQGIVFFPFGVYRLFDANLSGGKRASLSAFSQEADLRDDRYINPPGVSKGALTFEALLGPNGPVFGDIGAKAPVLHWVGEAMNSAAGRLKVLPAKTTLTTSRNRLELITRLAESLGADFYFDRMNVLTMRKKPTFADPVKVRINAQRADAAATDEPAVLVSFTKKYTRNSVYNAAVVQSTDTASKVTYRGIAYDLEPSSPTRWGGPFGRKPRFYSSPFFRSNEQCAEYAKKLLAESNRLKSSLDFEFVPNPLVDLGDVVELQYADGSVEKHIIRTLETGLSADGSMKSGTAADSNTQAEMSEMS